MSFTDWLYGRKSTTGTEVVVVEPPKRAEGRPQRMASPIEEILNDALRAGIEVSIYANPRFTKEFSCTFTMKREREVELEAKGRGPNVETAVRQAWERFQQPH